MAETEDNEDPRAAMTAEGIKEDFDWHLRYTLAKNKFTATDHDRFLSLAATIRDRIVERWIVTQETYHKRDVKRIYYLSLEFLMGRLLGNNVINLRMDKAVAEAMDGIGVDWNILRDFETDAGLGNGGLGRLAACFLDSMATMGLPAIGYGLRYEYGIFKQVIRNGEQVEEPDRWLDHGYPWEIERPEYSCEVKFEGHSEPITINGVTHWRWAEASVIKGVPYDVPIVGYGGKTVNTLRLWSARATDEFDFHDFNAGSYVGAVENKVHAENLTKVLYPNDNVMQGKELRLRQQYFFISCSVQDILRRFREDGLDFHHLPERIFIQLNDTHPTLVIPELMRILIDREMLEWDDAWEITRKCTGYTNHTILPEALERWSLPLLQRLLPRHMQIIYEINGRFLRDIAEKFPGDFDRMARMSIIDEAGSKYVRMANLAVIGSCSVNGVAALHTRLLREKLFKDFNDIWPEKFSNKTNGITQRRWLLKANPKLAALVTEACGGDDWICDLSKLRMLESKLGDGDFMWRFRQVKSANKAALAKYIKRTQNIDVDPESLFDVQVKRLHEYKRQLLLALYIIVLYNRLLVNPNLDIQPRTFIFGAKAAPGYAMAKLIIRLVNGIADVVNNHPIVGKKLRVVFMPDYCVSLAERIIPAADISEQISLAGLEASGTGNMKLMLNGAITMGTLDGANVEIAEEVGDDNIFIFGLKADEVLKARPTYSPLHFYNKDIEIRQAVDRIRENAFSIETPGLFMPIVQSLLAYGDHYMLMADMRSYIDTQDRAAEMYRHDRDGWTRRSLLNVARAGKFSSDRTIREYADEIWHVASCPVD